MKKLGMIKIILVSVMALTLIFVATSVFAAEDVGFNDLTSTLNAPANASANTNNTNTNNTNTNNANTNTNNTTVTNSSSYNNTTELPSTGIEDSLPTVAVIAVLIISAVYAYKKIKDYKNI